MTKYHKLVRDLIPEVVAEEGQIARARFARPEELRGLLFAKLREEIDELEEEPSVEELADVYEVLEALREHHDYSDEDVAKAREKKKVERGGFRQGVILESVRDEEDSADDQEDKS
ncbi:nucleoside triphosphate pyrophosphohydrolase [Alkalicoccus chagannorensis]|uniref:nucleoside triphosphate pyrophosphohydrolase n=1 Tax=Alkalicoccus chagannorensis TaxID=427072 RepID=UPI00041C834E|nr:nucleoside triphosphate pyrophosphohydrolase [Alkalicoccus chagannorensis]